MATPILRQLLSLDEALGFGPQSDQEVKNPRTPNTYNFDDPNWQNPVTRFGLGNYNSVFPQPEVSLSQILSMMEHQTELLVSILNKMVEALTKETPKEEPKKTSKEPPKEPPRKKDAKSKN